MIQSFMLSQVCLPESKLAIMLRQSEALLRQFWRVAKYCFLQEQSEAEHLSPLQAVAQATGNPNDSAGAGVEVAAQDTAKKVATQNVKNNPKVRSCILHMTYPIRSR